MVMGPYDLYLSTCSIDVALSFVDVYRILDVACFNDKQIDVSVYRSRPNLRGEP